MLQYVAIVHLIFFALLSRFRLRSSLFDVKAECEAGYQGSATVLPCSPTGKEGNAQRQKI